MARWLDLVLLGDETQLVSAIQSLDEDQRGEVLEALAGVVGLTPNDLVNGLIRLLVERARPLALPARLWGRDVTSSDDPRDIIRAHFTRKGIHPSDERVTAAALLYNRFVDERGKTPVRLEHLQAAGFRCAVCGLAFCNEQLESKNLVSPHGNRGRDKIDPLKPHWNQQKRFREPTHDHIWPIHTYGDNSSGNLQVICLGCNAGKENVLAFEQVKPWSGLITRASLAPGKRVDWVSFYAQMRQHPICYKTGDGPAVCELTVELIDPSVPPVLGNLRTVVSPGL